MESDKERCIGCNYKFTIKTLNKWSGKCKKCYDLKNIMPMDIDKSDRILHTIGEHRQTWLTHFYDRFETICPKCLIVTIDVFTFQSDTINGTLVPMCNNCCHYAYRRRHDPLNREVWITYIGKYAVINCPIGCHNQINVFNFEKGHVISKFNGGANTLENLRPICAPCNNSMGTENMITYATRFQSNNRIIE